MIGPKPDSIQDNSLLSLGLEILPGCLLQSRPGPHPDDCLPLDLLPVGGASFVLGSLDPECQEAGRTWYHCGD